MSNPSFIKEKDGGYVYNGDGMFVFYVPEKFFDTKLAIFNGEFVSLFGMLTYALLDKNGKPVGGLHEFSYPAKFITKPDEIEILKNIQLTKDIDAQDYRVFKYNKDGKIVVHKEIVVDTSNLNDFYRAIQYGNIPNTIKYDKLQEYFLKNILLTENNYDVSLQVIGVLISECARSANNIETPFRLSKNNNMNAYRMVNIREIPRTVSPFSALTSETWDTAVINSMITKKNYESPFEKIMMD